MKNWIESCKRSAGGTSGLEVENPAGSDGSLLFASEDAEGIELAAL